MSEEKKRNVHIQWKFSFHLYYNHIYQFDNEVEVVTGVFLKSNREK